jgi:hypothetical protein
VPGRVISSGALPGSGIVVAAMSQWQHRCGTDAAGGVMVADLVSSAASGLCVI